jgi:hypothetical protein
MATNQNVTQLTQQVGSANTSSLFYAAVGSNDTGLPLSVFVNNLGLTGVPTAPTAAVNTNTIQIASCAFVINQGYLTTSSAASTYAPKANPTFTGTIGGASASISLGGMASFSSIQSTPIGTTSSAAGSFTTLSTTGIYTSNNATQSTNSTTGAITTLGGIGVTGNANIGGAVGVGSTLQVGGLATLAGGIQGVTNGSNAAAGNVGEYQSVTVSTAVSLTTTTYINIASLSLTAGDWDVQGVVDYLPAASTVIGEQVASISTASATTGGLGFTAAIAGAVVTGTGHVIPTPVSRLSLTTTTTVYLVGWASFNTSTCTAQGFLSARRIR